MSEHEHFGRLAHQLTPPRRAVLEALAACGPMTAEQIADCWRERDPDLTPLVARSLPKLVVDSVWRLGNLDAVTVEDRTVSITGVGRSQLAAG